jgi:hypothetical protein
MRGSKAQAAYFLIHIIYGDTKAAREGAKGCSGLF